MNNTHANAMKAHAFAGLAVVVRPYPFASAPALTPAGRDGIQPNLTDPPSSPS